MLNRTRGSLESTWVSFNNHDAALQRGIGAKETYHSSKKNRRKGGLLVITVLLMGFLDKLVSVLGLRKKEANVLVVGLDNSGLPSINFKATRVFAGKSTLLNHFKPEQEQNANIVPTVGFNVEKFKSKAVQLSSVLHLWTTREINVLHNRTIAHSGYLGVLHDHSKELGLRDAMIHHEWC